jgi:hypothetical protein
LLLEFSMLVADDSIISERTVIYTPDDTALRSFSKHSLRFYLHSYPLDLTLPARTEVISPLSPRPVFHLNWNGI